jgi:hypothetical protein
MWREVFTPTIAPDFSWQLDDINTDARSLY